MPSRLQQLEAGMFDVAHQCLRVILPVLALPIAMDCNSEEVPGVKLEIMLDSESPRFPDPVYGFVRVRNMLDAPSYVPGLVPGTQMKLELHFGSSILRRDFTSSDSPRVRMQLKGFSSAKAFKFRYSDPEIIKFIRHGSPCSVTASLPVRPKQIPPDVLGSGKPIPLYESGVTMEFLVSEAETKFLVTQDLWIFKEVPNDLTKIAEHPAAWRTEAEVFEITRGLGRADDSALPHVMWLDLAAIEAIPILAVYPERLNGIQDLLICDTASWRLLELRNIMRRYYLETSSIERMQRVIDELIELLNCCGPAELFVLEHQISIAFSNGRPRLPNDAPEDVGKINVTARNHWAEQLRRHFPGDPMSGLLGAADYGKDGKYIQMDQVDIDKPRGRRILELAWEKAGKVGPPPCSCEWIENKRSESPDN